MERVAKEIAGYDYGAVPASPVSMAQLEALKVTVDFTGEDEHYLRMAGEVLADQVEAVVKHWRDGIIKSIPNLARHSRSLENEALPDYLAASNLRFEQWILDTCLRPYDQEWLNYQQEIALRHTSAKKNMTDGVKSTAYVPLHDILGFIAVMNETIKPYMAAKGHAPEDVEGMHRAWCASMQLQMALWAKPYTEPARAASEW